MAAATRRVVELHDLLVPRKALDRQQRRPRQRLADAALQIEDVGVRHLLARQQRGNTLLRVTQRLQQRAHFVETGDT